MLGPKLKYLQTGTDIISSEQLRKLKKIKPFGHSKAPKKKTRPSKMEVYHRGLWEHKWLQMATWNDLNKWI